MSRILLADDSPHAQRMGERILREEGFEVVTVTDGQTAMMRLADVDPDVILADISLPRKSGYDICSEVKGTRRFAHVRVVLTAGLLEKFDEERADSCRADGVLKKPFESSVLVGMMKPLAEAAREARASAPAAPAASASIPAPAPPPVLKPGPQPGAVPVRVLNNAPEPPPPPAAAPAAAASVPADAVDPERVRAAVTLALDAALPSIIDKITERVLLALRQ